jgi:hypothetical protein
MPRWLKYVLLALILMLIASIPLAMQFDRGSIQGTILDNVGPVAKASVEARNVMTGSVTRAESDAGGNYKPQGLRAGRYSLWIQAASRDSIWIREVTVERGATRKDVDLTRTPTTTTGL